MKKIAVSIAMAAACLFFVCACNGSEPKYNPPLQPSQSEIPSQGDTPSQGDIPQTSRPNSQPNVITEIKTAYYNKHKEGFVSEYYTYTTDDISLDYYGEYNGAYIVYITAPCFDYTAAIEEQKIDGVTIVYPSGQKLEAYYEGSFYSLEAAFEEGYIDHGNLVDISKNFKYDSFFPYPDKSVVDRVKTCYYEIHKDDAWFKNCTADDVGVNFYGEYRGAYVMFIGPPMFDVDDAITEQNIDGVKIIYSDSFVMEVFYGGKFYSLNEAFDNGYLTHDNLVDIRNKHKAAHSYLYK